MSQAIKILLADDHETLLEAVAFRLDQEADLQVVGRVFKADDAVTLARTAEPDVVVLDIDLPGKASFDAAREIKQDRPQTHIIYLSGFTNDRYIEDALRSGCSGYLTKDEPLETVINAIRNAVRNGAYFSPRVRERLIVDPEKGLTLDGGGGGNEGVNLNPARTGDAALPRSGHEQEADRDRSHPQRQHG